MTRLSSIPRRCVLEQGANGGLVDQNLLAHAVAIGRFFLIENCRIISDRCSGCRYDAVRIEILSELMSRHGTSGFLIFTEA